MGSEGEAGGIERSEAASAVEAANVVPFGQPSPPVFYGRGRGFSFFLLDERRATTTVDPFAFLITRCVSSFSSSRSA
jgi:hypothetical protein